MKKWKKTKQFNLQLSNSKAITNRWEYNFLGVFPYSGDAITTDIRAENIFGRKHSQKLK